LFFDFHKIYIRTFVDIVATEYRPGFIRLSGNDFVLSISLPLITLANLVPPRALMAWDRRLLASPQHLTLLLSGFHGLYPVLECDASYTPIAQRLGVCLNFKVGLCERYKPGRDHVQEIIRKHGLVTLEAEDDLRIQEERSAQQIMLSAEGEMEGDDETFQDVMVGTEKCTSVDPDRFDRFSLSSSLESLMDQSFLKLVQIRRKYGLGWAGAEVLHSESEKLQMKEHDVLTLKSKAKFTTVFF
jgi:ubiquitin-conjugating enzyme E2 Q